MKHPIFIKCLFTSFLFILFACQNEPQQTAKSKKEQNTESTSLKKQDWAIVIHGGAGYMTPENLNTEKQKEYTKKLTEVLSLGEKLLSQGKSAVDVVEACIKLMEDSPLFNAGKGSVFTHEGRNEMDASIMSGNDLNAGAVAGISKVKNPISAARKVMEQSKHVMLSRLGAEEFAKEQGLEMVPPSYFFTESSFSALKRALGDDSLKVISDTLSHKMKKFGTVGVVVLDKNGNLAAGTSTGGMTNKQWGRIGDSPLIAAGTYANNQSCGVSCTGHGEYFIRAVAAFDIHALVYYKGLSIEEAAQKVVMDKLVKMGGDGGIVALDKYGNPAMAFNTPGMFRGYANATGEKRCAIFKNE